MLCTVVTWIHKHLAYQPTHIFKRCTTKKTPPSSPGTAPAPASWPPSRPSPWRWVWPCIPQWGQCWRTATDGSPRGSGIRTRRWPPEGPSNSEKTITRCSKRIEINLNDLKRYKQVCLFVCLWGVHVKEISHIYTQMGDTTKDLCSIPSLAWPGSCPCLDASLRLKNSWLGNKCDAHQLPSWPGRCSWCSCSTSFKHFFTSAKVFVVDQQKSCTLANLPKSSSIKHETE